jgi:Golgi apyrase
MASIHSNDLTSLKLRTVLGQDLNYRVFVTTFLGYGVNEARRRYAENMTGVEDPCVPRGLGEGGGDGNLEKCIEELKPLLNKEMECPDQPCMFNGIHAPIEDFRHHKFVGVSEYWYSSQDIFELGGAYTYEKFYEAARLYCAKDWASIQSDYKRGKWPLVEVHNHPILTLSRIHRD